MPVKVAYLENQIRGLKNRNDKFEQGKLFAYQDILKRVLDPIITIDKTSLTNRELFIYISTSLATSPLLEGLDQDTRQLILRKVCGEFKNMTITNGDVYEIFHAIENLNTKLGLALNKHIDVKSLSIVRDKILSKPELISQSMKLIEDNPDLIKSIQKTLSNK